jgi:rfaE bifunctional protein nucleotidyltransferase chain/domain
MRVIYSAGVWDLLHRGHLNMLWQSKQLGDVLVVGVVSDAGTLAYKHRCPVQNSQARMRAIEQLAFVDAVVLQEGTDPTRMLERFRPDVMTHGDDWPELLEGHETLARLGVEWVLVPYTPGISTTILRGAA